MCWRRVVLLIEGTKLEVAIGSSEGEYEMQLRKHFPSIAADIPHLPSPFSHTTMLSELEQDVINLFQKQESGFFKTMEG